MINEQRNIGTNKKNESEDSVISWLENANLISEKRVFDIVNINK